MDQVFDGLQALLLESKTTPPDFNDSFVHRPALIDSLRSAEARLVTVTAPAGYGKTSLLAEWHRSEQRMTGWLTLQGEDDDPASVIRLLAHVCAPFTSEAESALSQFAGAEGAVLSRMAPTLALALSRVDRPFVLFVDDIHVLHDEGCLDALSVALAGVPRGSQVVLAGRQRATRYARGRLLASAVQVGADELRIDPAGAQRIADEVGVRVDGRTLDDWVSLCDGWAAGLHMCALLSRSRTPVSLGDSALVADYLYQECMRDLPDRTRQFLLQTSILTVHIPSLCDAILGIADSAQILRDLEAQQLFVSSDRERRAYRLHPLFREYLEGELRLEDVTSAKALHSKAARWFQEQGQLPQAIDHAISAGDFDVATALVTAAGLHAYEAGQDATLGRWLREIGDGHLLANPSAVIVFAWYAVLVGTDEDSDKWSTLLGKVPDDAVAEGINLLSAKAMIRAITMRDGMGAALRDAEFAVEVETLESPWRDPAVQILGSTLLHSGHDERAVDVLREAMHVADAHRNPATIAICEAELALLSIEDAGWEAAAEHAGRALKALQDGGIEGYVMSAYVFAAVACVELHAGRSDVGAHYLARGMAERQRCGRSVPLLGIPSRLLLIRAHLLSADTGAARILLREIEQMLPPYDEDRGALDRRLDAARRALLLQESRYASRGTSVALTAAEQRVLPYLQTHLTRAEIARRLFVSPNTVGTHITSIFRKFNAPSRADAVTRAFDLGLLGELPDLVVAD
ncbi:AAA family ATPase [Leifsonia shinshuensis]|nr:AAA family ATPase [Leifsonia shinshuensis]